MKANAIPTKFVVPFGYNVGGGDIRAIPLDTSDANAASLRGGFPPSTFTPVNAGGVPPDGRDFNGLFNQDTAWARWFSAGGPVEWDPTFSTAVGGYPKHAIVASAVTEGYFYYCLVDDNTTNPDTGGAGWLLFTLLTVFQQALAGAAINLRGTATGGTKLASWTADEMVVETALGGIGYKCPNMAVAINAATVGANGMDTGSSPTSGDLSIYLIFNPVTNTWATLGTITGYGATYSGTHMPAGYTASGLLWHGKTDASGNILQFAQVNRKIYITELGGGPLGNVIVYTANLPTTPTSVSCSTYVPPGAVEVFGGASCSGAPLGFLWIAGTPGNGIYAGGMAGVSVVGFGVNSMWGPVPLVTPQMLYYYSLLAGQLGGFWVSGYSI
jgi:hypothetical protein